ncbi:MAG: hypothetical protein IMZ57_02320 [Acidobacteria bacterium]|nr:hypothetical protein [Acidobacteriota bacterium]
MSKTLKIILIVLAGLVLVGVGYGVARLLQDNPQEQEVTFTVMVSAPGAFAIDMSPKNAAGDPEVSVARGTPAVFQITNVPTGGYDAKIEYSIGGLPAGSYSFSVNPVTPGQATTLTIQTSALVSNTAYVCTLTANSF